MNFVGGCKTIVALVMIVCLKRKHEFFSESNIKIEKKCFQFFVGSEKIPIKMQRVYEQGSSCWEKKVSIEIKEKKAILAWRQTLK